MTAPPRPKRAPPRPAAYGVGLGGPALSTFAAANEKKKKPADPMRWVRRSRSVLIYGPIEPKLTKEVTSQMLLLDAMSPVKPIKVYVNSPGGVADDGFALYDLFRFVRAPVYTIVTGMAASASPSAIPAPSRLSKAPATTAANT